MRKKAFLELGKIVATHGVKGFLKVEGWCDDIYIFKSLPYIYLNEPNLKKIKIEEVKFKKNFALLLLEEIKSVEEAKKLIGEIVYVRREDLKINENEYFIQDLLGIKVFNNLERTKCYGEILDVIKIKNNFLYLIRNERKEEIMLPANEEFIKERKIEEGKIYVELIEGLLEIWNVIKVKREIKMFKADVATLFPEMFDAILNCSILKKAKMNKLTDIAVHNIRDYSEDKHKRVDDYVYGGGFGMLIKAEPIFKCYEAIKIKRKEKIRVIYLSAQGKILNQEKIMELSRCDENLLLLCGHYEGIDQRILDTIVDEEISIGDYVLSGGELGALVLLDAVIRTIPGVLSDEECYKNESHYNGLLEYPQYTRPEVWRGLKIPEVLKSGNHKNIEEWRKKKSLEVTKLKRPDMFTKHSLKKF